MSRMRPYTGPLAVVAFGLAVVVGGAQLFARALLPWAGAQIMMFMPRDPPAGNDTSTYNPVADAAGGAVQVVLALIVLGVGIIAGGFGLMWAWLTWRRRVRLSRAAAPPPEPSAPVPED